jgi:hypothetical protein
MRTRRWFGPAVLAAGLAAVVTAVLAACTGAPGPAPTSGSAGRGTVPETAPTTYVRWTRLPAVPDATTLSWVTSAGGQLLVSGTRGDGKDAPPGLWRGDGRGGWRAVGLAPVTYYGRRALLFRVASDGRRVVALGRRIGGTHGSPRFTSWTGTPTALHETEQPFELFGGPDSIGVTDLAMTGDGGLVLGAWARHGDPAGVTVWRQQGDTWRRFDEAAGLKSEVTDVGSELTTPAAVTTRGGEPVLVGWTVHLAAGEVGLRASLWQPAGSGWQEVRLPAGGDAQARAVTCHQDVCTVAGTVAGRLAVWRVRGAAAAALAVPAVDVGDRETVLATAVGSAAWVSVADGESGHILVVDGTTARAVSAPPGRVLAMTGGEGATALVHQPDGTWSLWRAGPLVGHPSDR